MIRLDVVAGILWRDGQYLAVQRPEGKAQAGWWEFPGGKIEAGETPEQALIRELREELSVTVRHAEFWQLREHTYTGTAARLVRLHFFHIHRFTGEPQPNDGQAMRWTTPEAACTLPFLAADMPLVRLLAASTAEAAASIHLPQADI